MLWQVNHVDSALYNYCISCLTNFTGEAKKLFGEVCTTSWPTKITSRSKCDKMQKKVGKYDSDVYL